MFGSEILTFGNVKMRLMTQSLITFQEKKKSFFMARKIIQI